MHCTHIALHNLDSFDLDTWTKFTPNGSDVLVAFEMHHQAISYEHMTTGRISVVSEQECMHMGKPMHRLAMSGMCKIGRKWKSSSSLARSSFLSLQAKQYAGNHVGGNRPVGRHWLLHLMVQLPGKHQQPRPRLQ